MARAEGPPHETPSGLAAPALREASGPAAGTPPPPPVPSPFAAARPPKLSRAGSDREAGDVIAGRYKVTRLLGRGGMGAVYLCEQLNLGRSVAVKVLTGSADATMVARFQREARLIAQFHHPHVVGLIDFGEDEGALYLVMEYIDGETLTALLERDGALPEGRVVELASQIVEALAVAHGLGIIHRDVKPDNIMVIKSSTGREFVKVLDFGVAKMNRDEARQEATMDTLAGLIVGSLRYISPEQVESRPVTARTDLYGLGCVLYQMLTGRAVFTYESSADCALAHLSERPERPSLRGLTLAGPLVDLIMRCLAKNPAERPPDARAVLDALLDQRAHLEAVAPPRSTGIHRALPAEPDGPARANGRDPDVHAAPTAATLGKPPNRPPPTSTMASRPTGNAAGAGAARPDGPGGSHVLHHIDAPLLAALAPSQAAAPRRAPAATRVASRRVPLGVWVGLAVIAGAAVALLLTG